MFASFGLQGLRFGQAALDLHFRVSAADQPSPRQLYLHVNNLMRAVKITALASLLLVGLFIVFPRQSIVIALIIGGKIIAPEASAILAHYCFGNGDTLRISPDYLRRSPVVLQSINGLRKGETRRIVFKQNEDWRLSYALNPFHVKKIKGGYIVFQYIEFASNNQTFTVLDLWFAKFVVRDDIAHVFDCKPFMAVCRFTTP